jgi:hypothetical protein
LKSTHRTSAKLKFGFVLQKAVPLSFCGRLL